MSVMCDHCDRLTEDEVIKLESRIDELETLVFEQRAELGKRGDRIAELEDIIADAIALLGKA